MRAWRFKLKNSPIEITEKLESELKSIGGFVINTHKKNQKSVTFKMRKRILYVWYVAFQNWTIVKGQLVKNDLDNETQVEITFNQHFFVKFLIITHIIIGIGFLVALGLKTNLNTASYIVIGTLSLLIILLWIALQRKFEKDVQKYKTLMSGIFEIQ